MATLLENLQTRQAAIGVELATIETTLGEYRSDAGSKRKSELEDYRLKLYEELDKLDSMMVRIADPVEELTRGI